MDEKADERVASIEFPEHVPCLLRDPSGIGMRRAASEVNPTTAHFDKKQHIDRLQKKGLDGEKIAGQHHLFDDRGGSAGLPASLFPLVGPLVSNQLTMPLEDRFRLNQANDLTQLLE